MKGYRLPPGLMLGAATASAQIEGGFVPHSWREWERRGKLHPEASAVSITEASGHWKNWKEDIDPGFYIQYRDYLMSYMNTDTRKRNLDLVVLSSWIVLRDEYARRMQGG